MRRHERRRAEPRPARAGARVEGRVLTRALAIAIAIAGCRGGDAKTPVATDPCRAIAVHGRALIDAQPAAERELALRPVVGAIDLCQRPGLIAASLRCLLAAPTLVEFRSCRVITQDVAEDDPSFDCPRAVTHAMQLLEADGSRPRTRDGRAHARAAYTEHCAGLTLAGRRCVIAATSISAVDDCFADTAHARAAP